MGLGVLRMIKPWPSGCSCGAMRPRPGHPEITDEFARELAAALVLGADDFEIGSPPGCRGR